MSSNLYRIELQRIRAWLNKTKNSRQCQTYEEKLLTSFKIFSINFTLNIFLGSSELVFIKSNFMFPSLFQWIWGRTRETRQWKPSRVSARVPPAWTALTRTLHWRLSALRSSGRESDCQTESNWFSSYRHPYISLALQPETKKTLSICSLNHN